MSGRKRTRGRYSDNIDSTNSRKYSDHSHSDPKRRKMSDKFYNDEKDKDKNRRSSTSSHTYSSSSSGNNGRRSSPRIHHSSKTSNERRKSVSHDDKSTRNKSNDRRSSSNSIKSEKSEKTDKSSVVSLSSENSLKEIFAKPSPHLPSRRLSDQHLLRAMESEAREFADVAHEKEPLLHIIFPNLKVKDKNFIEVKREKEIVVRPEFSQKIHPTIVRDHLAKAINETLNGQKYSEQKIASWMLELNNKWDNIIKQLSYSRYKFILNIIIGEMKQQGISSAFQCLWDANSDCAVKYTYINESLFCIGNIYGVYLY